jgi:hypothetical protein
MDLPNKQEPPKEVPKKNIVAVVGEGVVVKAPRPVTRRFFDFVFAESPKDIAKRVLTNTLAPRLKAAGEEAANNFLHSMLWGQGSAPVSSIVKGTVIRGGTNVYAQASGQPSALQQAREANQSRPSGIYQDLTCPTQEIAEQILAQLYDVFNQYRVVSVADLYEMAKIPVSTSDNAYGWMSLDGARITQDRNGYVLALPRPTLI